MKKSLYSLILALALLPSGCTGQSAVQALVDDQHSATAEPSVALPSRFETLPLVEPHISAHPGNRRHLLAAAMIVTDINRPYESCRLVSFVSLDGGATWKETVHDWWGYDPWVSIAADGTTVMSWIGTEGSFQDKYPVQIFSSPDGGVTWSKDVQTLPGMHDGTKITEWNGRFYFTTVRFRESEGADVVLFSKAQGQEFVEQGVIDGKGTRLNFCEPAVTIMGIAVVPATSRDAAWVQHYDPEKRGLSPAKVIAKRPVSWRGYARMVSDANANSPYRNRIYFIRAIGKSGLIVNRSNDGGETWARDLRVDHFAKGVYVNALVPSVAVNRQGVLGLSWINQRDDGSGSEVFFTASFDGGESFIRPVRLSAATDPRTAKNGDVANKFPGGGHYLGLAALADRGFQAIWSDSRNGLFQLQTCRIDVQ